MPSTLDFGTRSDYENAQDIRDWFKQSIAAGMESIPTPKLPGQKQDVERIEATKTQFDPISVALPVISAGPQRYAADLLKNMFRRNPRMEDWFKRTFDKQEAVSELGNPIMGFHGRKRDFPLNEIRGGQGKVIDQIVGPHFAVDPAIAKQFALHRGYDTQNIGANFEEEAAKWLKNAEDSGYGYIHNPQMPDSNMAAYDPIGGNIIPAFIRSKKPYIIRQGFSPTTFLPAPTPMVNRGADTVSRENTPGLMPDSNAISRDFFHTLFQKPSKQVAVTNAHNWVNDSEIRKMSSTVNKALFEDLYYKDLLAQHIHGQYKPLNIDQTDLMRYVQKYKNALSREGYDSIMYHNTVEAPGDLDPRTFIPLDTSNIISPYDFERLRHRGVK